MNSVPKLALISGMFAFGVAGLTGAAFAQAKKAAPAAKGKNAVGGFTKLENGLEFKLIKHGDGTRKPVVTDHIELNILVHIKDSIMFDSRKMYNNKPVPLTIASPKTKGDLMVGFMNMVAGDSAMFRFSVDTLKQLGQPMPPWTKEGDMVEYNVKLVSVRTDAEEKKHNEEMAQKQNGIDDKILQDYFAKNNIKATKTASGLYYVLSSDGKGDMVKSGQKVSVNYTGKFMDGKPFDSNTDTAFHHTEPFQLVVNKGNVIKGWDEGLQLLRPGAKATFYIPSSLAYGSVERPPIPANSILVFDVEVLSAETPVNQAEVDDKVLQDYFAKNNIKATKTASGLYYTISQKGVGPTAAPGKKVTMNYTGKLLDGKVFDSNTDPAMGHVQPFTFPLGQGRVIRGWDEGVQLLQLGSKGTFYIPSGMAYGERGGGGKIPPNAVLIFDVEVTGIDN